MSFLKPEMSLQEVKSISMLGLAHVGDGVYELLNRSQLCREGHTDVQTLHRLTVARVRAEAQAKAAAHILPLLTEEALFGWLYLLGRLERIDALFAAIMEEEHAT